MYIGFIILFLAGVFFPDDSFQNNTADVLIVKTTGTTDNYTFSVTLKSPDTGCEQYANWWEVISPEGDLIYRRILGHSHVDEQPFTRSGGPVRISEDREVIIRAHMNNAGYGGKALKGSVAVGFKPVELAGNFANDLEKVDPLPSDCSF